jgi:hypothetical protein
MRFDDVEHAAVILGIFLTLLGIAKAITAWREQRDEAICARALQQEALGRVLKQFENNGGSSLLDKVEEGNRKTESIAAMLDDHVSTAEDYWATNNRALEALNRRVDGMFEQLLARSNANSPRKTADRHASRTATPDEV